MIDPFDDACPVGMDNVSEYVNTLNTEYGIRILIFFCKIRTFMVYYLRTIRDDTEKYYIKLEYMVRKVRFFGYAFANHSVWFANLRRVGLWGQK